MSEAVVNNKTNDRIMDPQEEAMQTEEDHLESTGGDNFVGGVSDNSLNSTGIDTSVTNATNDSGASTASSDVEKLYETVSNVSRRQKGHFPVMVPGNCTIDTDMVSSSS